MRGWGVRTACVCLVLGLAVAAFLWFARPHGRVRTKVQEADATATAAPEPDRPPPGLPILPSKPRDWFHIIRDPQYLDVIDSAGLLMDQEPVLGLVLGGQVRAYSTNQLNDHEMVLDEIAGTAVLVTY
jgi:hypothetical protein